MNSSLMRNAWLVTLCMLFTGLAVALVFVIMACAISIHWVFWFALVILPFYIAGGIQVIEHQTR